MRDLPNVRQWPGAMVRAGLGIARRRSLRLVNMPPESGIGVGNMLSFWLWAHAERRAGRDAWTMRTTAMDPWLAQFPTVRDLLIDRSEIGLLSARTLVWGQEWDLHPRDVLEDFVRQRILTAPRLEGARAADSDNRSLTINVRRGDYYSDPRWHALYGFDIDAYVRVAFDGARRQGPIERINVVSDDAEWCRRNLSWLADKGRDVAWHGPNGDPMDHFVRLASARRLILGNSSFSYWGAYVSNVLHGDNHELVWAPRFHRRDINDGVAWQLDPTWSVVRHIPGGWALAD